MKNLSPRMTWILVGLALIFNILWYFVPMGDTTGARALVEVHWLLGILALIPLAFLTLLTVHAVKKW